MRSSIEQLAATGQVGEALELLRRLANPSPELRILRAELESLASNRTVAAKIADDVASRPGPPAAVVRALVLSGRLSFYSGRVSEGQQRFNSAKELAADSNDAYIEAFAVGQHIESLMRFVGLEAAVGELAYYKKVALRAGQHSSLAMLHRVLAEAELKAGRGHRALKELDLSGLHVDATGDLVSLAQLHFARSAAVGLMGNLTGAYEAATAAVDVAARCGAEALLRSAQVNVLHCQVVLGLHEQAAATLASLSQVSYASIDRELDLRANQLVLATAIRDGSLASSVDGHFGPIAANRSSVNAQWYKLESLTSLSAFGRAHEAAAIGLGCLDNLDQADKHYIARLQAATAEALVFTDDTARAAGLLANVVTGTEGHLPEFIATTQRVSGHLSADVASAAFEHLARSARIFGHLGHVVGRGEALHHAAALRASFAPPGSPDAAVPHITTFYAKPPDAFGRVDLPSESTPASMPQAVASTVRSTAALVDLTSRPALAGYELLTLVAASGAASTAVMFGRQGDAVDVLGWIGDDAADAALRTPPADCVTFALGQDRDRDISVVVRPRNHRSARTTLLALQRLAANGTALHRAAVAESEKSAIWPEPLPEQQLGFVCVSESMLDLLRVTRRVASSSITVLITGETGTGKELLARAVHNCSPRAKHRFLPFNCTAVPRDLLDAQLFGHKRGAFTGAQDAFPGVIRSAAGGTLFLDEIGELGLDVQPKLLRFLESSDVHPLGEPAPVSVDVRIVAATNANLDKLVAEGRFRDDLYYRLNVVKLTIPPLRERREEIPLLLDHFLERSQKESSKAGIRIGDTATEFLLLYDWPGNVRELANEVRRAVALAESGAVLMPEHLSARLAASRRTVPVGQRPPAPTELLVRRDQPLSAAVEHVERALIQDALRVHGNVEDAARALGLSRKGLYLKRQRLRIDDE